MKRILFIVTFMTASVAVFGQVKFEEGYFISTEGQRTACQIRNVDWRNNPKSFEYRLGADGESKEVSIDQVVEFGVTNGSTFKRFAVKIDRSTSDLTRMTYNRNPEFVDETLFLRVLIEGKGSLYEYSEDKFLRYFYTVDQSLIQQLVFKIGRAHV